MSKQIKEITADVNEGIITQEVAIGQVQELQNNINTIQKYSQDNNIKDIQEQITDLDNNLGALQDQLNQNDISVQEVENTSQNSLNETTNDLNVPNLEVNTPVENKQELDNSSFNLKEKQNEIIQNSNPAGNETATWIRNADKIKTFEETLQDSDYKEYYDAGEDFDETYTADMAKKALETGKITVYSSYPIEQGIFVSPSKMEAQSYSGNGKVYSKEVNLNDVAWIDPTQGQYAKVNNIPTNNQTINQIKENTVISEELFSKEVEDALKNNQSKGNIIIAVSKNNRVINLIKKITGIDISNRRQILSKDYIRHLFKHSNETNPGQISITIDDIKKIPDILSNPDDIVKGSKTLDASRKNKISSIRYIKADNTGKMFVIEAIPNKGDLQIKTMWKEPTKLIHSNNALHHTSETANSNNSTTLINSNIPQSNSNVKLPIVTTNSNMQNNENNAINLPIGENIEIMMPTEKIFQYATGGGYRTNEQIESLKNDIRLNGIKNPIELIVRNNGETEIYNGNHRLKIAQELGIKNVPVKYIVDYVDEFAKNNKKMYNNEKGVSNLNETNTSATKASANIKRSRNITGNDRESNVMEQYRETTVDDDRLSNRQQEYNNGSSNISRNGKNSILRKGLEDSSFSFDKKINLPIKEDINKNETKSRLFICFFT